MHPVFATDISNQNFLLFTWLYIKQYIFSSDDIATTKYNNFKSNTWQLK